ncbi:hypothetical protein I4U23_022153 [Adineta vaga]|nr:hypothetical protein I4U23_022153 [Adineta vaga]
MSLFGLLTHQLSTTPDIQRYSKMLYCTNMHQVSIISRLILLLLISQTNSIQSQSCETSLTWSQNGIPIITGDNLKANKSSFRPAALAFDSQWNLYIADSGNKLILMYPTNITANQTLIPILSNVSSTSLFIDKNDNLYYNDENTVKIFDLINGNIRILNTSYYDPRYRYYRKLTNGIYLYVDKNLTLYVLDSYGKRVIRFSSENPNTSDVIAGRYDELHSPTCIYVDETDRNTMYICDSYTRILKYSYNAINGSVTADDEYLYENIASDDLLIPNSIQIDSVHQQMYVLDTGNRRFTRRYLHNNNNNNNNNNSNNTNQDEILINFLWMAVKEKFVFDKNKDLYVTYISPGTPKVLKFMNCCNNETFCRDAHSNSDGIRKLAKSIQFLQWLVFLLLAFY